MCGRFTTITWDEVEGVIGAIEAERPYNLEPDWPARRVDAFPKATAPIITLDEAGALEGRELIWGFDLLNSPGKVAFNTRIESAAQSSLWRESFTRRRCIVPAATFFEPHRSEMGVRDGRRVRQAYRFASADGSLLMMAGIWQGDRFSVMTREPDSAVAPVHDRMPLILRAHQANAWLSAGRTANHPEPQLIGAPIYEACPANQQLSLF